MLVRQQLWQSCSPLGRCRTWCLSLRCRRERAGSLMSTDSRRRSRSSSKRVDRRSRSRGCTTTRWSLSRKRRLCILQMRFVEVIKNDAVRGTKVCTELECKAKPRPAMPEFKGPGPRGRVRRRLRTTEGTAVIGQVEASRGWQLCEGDVDWAFLNGRASEKLLPGGSELIGLLDSKNTGSSRARNKATANMLRTLRATREPCAQPCCCSRFPAGVIPRRRLQHNCCFHKSHACGATPFFHTHLSPTRTWR